MRNASRLAAVRQLPCVKCGQDAPSQACHSNDNNYVPVGSFFMLDENTMLGQGDCLELMKHIPDGSVDMVLTDPPYGTTACKWDSVIPFEPMWEELKRIIKPNGAIVLFGSEPFSSMLRLSNIKQFKYDWVWEKEQGVNPLLSKKQPLNNIEYIHIFYAKQVNYNPQFEKGRPYSIAGIS